MSLEFPSADLQSGTMVIRFLDAVVSRSVQVPCVIDQTDFGDVLGIEILPFRHMTGGILEGPRSAGAVKWSYDEEDDVFYIHVMKGRSQIQKSIVGTVRLDVAQRVVCLEVPVPPPAY